MQQQIIRILFTSLTVATSLSQYHKTYANLFSSPYHKRHRIDGVFNEAANVNITGNLQPNIVLQSSGVAGGETVVKREER